MSSAVLLIYCPDTKGLVATVATFLYQRGANILHSDQHQDQEAGLFFMRIEWDLEGFTLSEGSFGEAFAPVAERFQMRWRLAYPDVRSSIAIFVSRYQHCLIDLLYRHSIGDLRGTVRLVISNHRDAEGLAAFYGIPFHCEEINPHNRAEVERRQLERLRAAGIDLVVLARYMQILSPEFVACYQDRILNVHHSFLPAFSGARPYHAAHRRGVKLIGATSHYVSEALDDGPIIEQDVLRISHRDQIEDLIQKGRDLERVVLSRAVQWHLDHRILHFSGKTVVFD